MLEDLARPLRSGLARLRARVRTLLMIHGTSRILVFLLACVVLLFLADYFLRLPAGVRRIAFLALLAGLGAVVLRRLIRPLSTPLSDERLATHVETSHPELKDRLASSLSFCNADRDPDNEDSPELMRAVVEETTHLVSSLSFTSVANTTPTLRWAAVALAFLGIGGAAAYAERDLFATFMKRNLLWQDVSWPRRTTLVVEDMDPRTPRHVTTGRETTIRVRALGSIPRQIEFAYWEKGQDRRVVERIDLAPSAEDPALFTLTLPVYTSYRFKVEGGDDDRGLVYSIDALTPPAILDIEIDCTYPEYLDRPPERRRGGDQRLPEGTRLDLSVHTNMEIERAAVSVGAEAEVPLERVGPKVFSWSVVLAQDLRYSFRLTGRNGQQNDPGSDSYVLRALRDRVPLVRIHTPSSGAERLPEGVLLVSFTARDDHEISGVTFVYTVGGRIREVPLDPAAAGTGPAALRLSAAPGEDPGMVVGLAVFDLTRLGFRDGRRLAPSDKFTYLVRATDSAGQVKETRPHGVDVVGEDTLGRRIQAKQQNLREAAEKAQTHAREADQALSALSSVLTAAKEHSELRSWARKAQGAEGRIVWDLRGISKQVVDVFNLYVFNRLDDPSAADQMLPYFERHLLELKEDSGAPFRGSLYRGIWDALVARQIHAGGSVAKLSEMADLADKLAHDHAPAAYRALDKISLSHDRAVATEALKTARDEHRALKEGLRRLARLMREWQSYESVVRAFRALKEIEDGVKTGVDNLDDNK